MTPIISEGLDLAVYGMGTVFFFLTMLVLATMLMSKIVGQPENPDTANLTVGTDSKKKAAIAAAIHQHRLKH